MKIFTDNYHGHISFMRMEKYWKKMGHKVFTSSAHECDVHLANVLFTRRSSLPKCLRLDSIYYNRDVDYKTLNKSLSSSHSAADAIIYQSDYSRRLIEGYLKPRKASSIYKVIYNGVDKCWSGETKVHNKLNIVLISKWRRHKRLKEIIELFIEFNKEYNEAYLHVLGLLHSNTPIKNKNITYYGMVNKDKVADILRRSDFSIHLSKRDSCPNSVVESIGAGVPVITTDNCGGATEICRMTPGCIIVTGDGDCDDTSPVSHYRDEWNVLPPDVFSGILSAMKKLAVEKTRVELPEELTAQYMAEQYIKVLEVIK